MSMLLVFVVCQFCEKDFVSIGRHSWRCKQRIHQGNDGVVNESLVQQAPLTNCPKVIIPTRSALKCCCGKVCKGQRGLKMHQRSCRLIHDMDSELQQDIVDQNYLDLADLNEVGENANDNITTVLSDEISVLKKGIRLPKRESEWATANEYFKFSLQPITSQDLNASIQQLNETIYEYFAENFGFSSNTPDRLVENKYKDCSIKELKKSLKSLKSR